MQEIRAISFDLDDSLWAIMPVIMRAEQVLHAAYWKYAARRQLRGEKRGSFPLKGSNWFEVPDEVSESDWQNHKRLLLEQHVLLRQAVVDLGKAKHRSFSEKQLRLISGVAAHDVYHAGQIRLLRAMYQAEK